MFADFFVLLTIIVYVIICPYTKVEESFNMQAIYDHLHYGYNIASYDHLQFPGVVPRTFIGSLAVSIVSSPLIYFARLLKLESVFHQMIVRVILGTFTWISFKQLRRAVQYRFSRRAAQIFMVFTSFQFHLCFYASRTLPNTFAVLMAAFAFSAWLERKPVLGLQILGIATVVFRCDMLILVGSMALTTLISGEIPFLSTFVTGIATCVAALVSTIAIDSFFWRQLLWPEGVVLFFNTVENKSSEWGISPWHWYATGAIPKSLTFTIPWVLVCIILSLIPIPKMKSSQEDKPEISAAANQFQEIVSQSRSYCKTALYFLAPAVLFITLYSYLPHKELRFIMPVLPLFTVTAAVAADQLLAVCTNSSNKLIFPLSSLASAKSSKASLGTKITSSFIWRLFSLGVQLALLVSWLLMFVCSHTFLLAAQHNYPGGEAIEHFLHYFVRSEASHHMHFDPHDPAAHVTDNHLPRLEPTFVHIDNLAATTGVTRFLQERYMHHHHLVPQYQRQKRRSSTSKVKYQALPMQYPPHLFLNTLPSTWHRLLANESIYHDKIIQEMSSQERENVITEYVIAEDLLVYSKDEHLLDIDKTEFDFLITEEPDEFLQSGQFVLREAIMGFDRMKLTRFGPQPVLKNKLFILENAYPHQYTEN